MSIRNTHLRVGADEDEVEANGAASDRDYMNQLQDEIAEQLIPNME